MSKANFNNPQSGSILIYTLLILGSILLIALSLTATFAAKLTAASNASSSVGAIYAADSGIEWCLYTNRGHTALPQPTLSNGATYTITPPDCTGTLDNQVVGTYRGVSRALQVETQNTTLNDLALGKPVTQSVPDNPPYAYPASNLTDGSESTLAYPGQTSFSYTVNLGSLTNVSQINAVVKTFGHNTTYTYITSWLIEGYNGSSWVTLGSGSSPNADVITVSPSAPISQIRVSAQSTANWIGIYELEAY